MIPRKVTGKFSIRIVPHMTPDEVERLVIDYLEKRHKESGSPNPIRCVLQSTSILLEYTHFDLMMYAMY